MNLFSISDLQQFSGIKAHTIRVWEQRYNALKPDRSEGNTRYYDGAQLRRLLNIVSLLNDNFKVSELCTMSDEQLNKLLKLHLDKNISPDLASEFIITQFIAAAIEFDEDKFDKIFANAVLKFGIKGTYIQVIYPALLRLGILWAKNDLLPPQEHFITNLIRQKLNAVIDALPPKKYTDKTWLLFLFEDEFHETGLLFANYIIRKAGHKVIYLGSNVPITSLESAVKTLKPVNLLFFTVRKNDSDMETIQQLKKTFPNQKIFMAADPSRLTNLKNTKNFVRLCSVEDLEKQIIQTV